MSPRWLLPVSVVTWLCAFALVVHLQTWAVLLVVAPLLAGLRLWQDPPARTLLKPNVRDVVIGLVGGAAMAAATHILYRVAISIIPALQSRTADLYALMGTTGHAGISLAALISVIVMAEEITFRSHVPFNHRASGILAASGVYALAHVTSQDPLLVMVALACGVVWTALRVWTRALVASLIVHLVWDLVVMVTVPLPH